MKLLVDTHVFLWLDAGDRRLPREIQEAVMATTNEVYVSAVSVWEIAIKSSLGKKDFQVDPRTLHRGLLDNGYLELAITSQHTIAVVALPPHHKDPFDRLLIAQAIVEGITLLTSDPQVARYPGSIRKI